MMRRLDIFLLIFGMAIVTYIPRALPAFLMDKLTLSKRVENFLSLLPYTALSALIFPGVFSVDAEHPLFGVAGAAIAAVLALKKCSLIVCVIAAVAVNCVLYLIF